MGEQIQKTLTPDEIRGLSGKIVLEGMIFPGLTGVATSAMGELDEAASCKFKTSVADIVEAGSHTVSTYDFTMFHLSGQGPPSGIFSLD